MTLGPAGQVAVLGRVGDGVPHAGDALLVHEVDDELELVEALEVGRLGLVAGVDQGLEAGLDERGETAAQHDLLAEEVGLGLLVEGGVEDPGPGGAEGVGVGEGQVVGLARGVLGHRDQRRDPAALGVGAADQVAGALGGDHGHVDARGRGDLAEADVEAVGEEEGVAVAQVGGDLGVVDATCSVSGRRIMMRSASAAASATDSDPQAGLLGLLARAEPSRSPTRTSTPDSARLRAWAWPWDP